MVPLEAGAGVTPHPQESYQRLMRYLHHLSGQEKPLTNQDHTYARPWNRHPDPAIKSRPARFLFMKGFPRHANLVEGGENPLVTEINALVTRIPGVASEDLDASSSSSGGHEKPPPDKTGWTATKHKLWSKSLRILHLDRLSRLAIEGRGSQVILRRNQVEKTASRFRQVFASIALWDSKLLSWLQSSLEAHVHPVMLAAWHEAMQLLRHKVPSLVERFYSRLPRQHPPQAHHHSHPATSDAIQTVLNNHRPKRIPGSPLFLVVPNGAQGQQTQRAKHWNHLLASLGKVVHVTLQSSGGGGSKGRRVTVSESLQELRLALRDKIKECRTTFSEGRALVLVGFSASSLVAAHAALEHATRVTACVLIGFPLTGVTGFRGDLDDPLLELTVPTLFVIGQQSSMCTLDDMEDFRERITRTQTALVVVGGCNDRLLLSSAGKRLAGGVTQGIVDRCIADEIYDFVTSLTVSSHDSPGGHSSSGFRSSAHRSPTAGKRAPLLASPAPLVPGSPVAAASPAAVVGSGIAKKKR